MTRSLIAGSRDSVLALTQTEFVVNAIRNRFDSFEFGLKTFKTKGDLFLEQALSVLGDKGLFVKELETALLAGEIDFAVHSMKDMPSEQPDGLHLLPFGQREIPLDAFVCTSGQSLQDLPEGAVVGTSSLRRQALVKAMRPDIRVEVVRGNVQTRLRKLDEGLYDAIILAAAGLHRLNLQNRITHLFSPEDMTPACCQGTLAVEFKDEELKAVFENLTDPQTALCTRAERAFLARLQGGCQVPMAAYAFQREGENKYQLLALVSDPEGKTIYRTAHTFCPDTAEQTGILVAETLLNAGGDAILKSLIPVQAQPPIDLP